MTADNPIPTDGDLLTDDVEDLVPNETDQAGTLGGDNTASGQNVASASGLPTGQRMHKPIAG